MELNKSHKGALAVIPPEESWEPIQKIRRQYDPQIRRWMPHINMIYPFYLPGQWEEDKKGELQKVCRNFAPFEITLAEIKHFSHRRSHTIWLSPEPAEVLVELQSRLVGVFPQCTDLNRFEGGFHPHLSVGKIKGKEKLHSVLKELEESYEPLFFKVHQLHYITRQDPPQDVFEIEEVFPLGE